MADIFKMRIVAKPDEIRRRQKELVEEVRQ